MGELKQQTVCWRNMGAHSGRPKFQFLILPWAEHSLQTDLGSCLWMPRAMSVILICWQLLASWVQVLPFSDTFLCMFISKFFEMTCDTCVIRPHAQWLSQKKEFICSREVVCNGRGVESGIVGERSHFHPQAGHREGARGSKPSESTQVLYFLQQGYIS